MIRKTAVMEIIKAHMDGEDKNTKAVLSDVMYSVNELETLEQEPCTDAVSREAVLEELYQWVIVGEYEYTNATEYLIKRVNELPSVQPMWVENSKGERIAFGKVGVDKAVKILEILGE